MPIQLIIFSPLSEESGWMGPLFRKLVPAEQEQIEEVKWVVLNGSTEKLLGRQAVWTKKQRFNVGEIEAAGNQLVYVYLLHLTEILFNPFGIFVTWRLLHYGRKQWDANVLSLNQLALSLSTLCTDSLSENIRTSLLRYVLERSKGKIWEIETFWIKHPRYLICKTSIALEIGGQRIRTTPAYIFLEIGKWINLLIWSTARWFKASVTV